MEYAVTIAQHTIVNESTRIIRLDFEDAETDASFLPGQWLHIHFDDATVSRQCGILSPPHAASSKQGSSLGSRPYVEAVIHDAPATRTPDLRSGVSFPIGMQVKISYSGDSRYLPGSPIISSVRRIVFVAGGVGAVPLVSILSHILDTNKAPQEVHFVYASRVKGYYTVRHVLALEQLLAISKASDRRVKLYLYFSGYPSRTLVEAAEPRQRFEPRVILGSDVLDLFDNPDQKHATVCYIAGPPNMTKYFFKVMEEKVGMDPRRVLCEEYEDESLSLHAEIGIQTGI